MKIKILFAVVGLMIFFAAGADAQIGRVGRVGRVKGAKLTARTEIRQFDFLDARYLAGCEGEEIRARNGHYEPQKSAGVYFEFDVSVSYGDLTGDGVEEVLVVTQCSGAVQNYDEGKIYTVKNHRLVKLAKLKVGTKNGGSIISGQIKNGRIIVKRGPGPDLCTDSADAAEETAVFRLRRKILVQVGKSVCNAI